MSCSDQSHGLNEYPTGLRLPPGPPRLPLIGNALDIPKHYEWETYAKWAKKYGKILSQLSVNVVFRSKDTLGEIFSLDVLGTPMIFLNSRRLVYECFERRSSLYSDRTTLPMVVDLCVSTIQSHPTPPLI